MSKLSLREINQSQLDTTPVIDGQLIVCLDTGNAYRDSTVAHVKIGSDLEVVSELPLAPLADKIYYLKPDKLYVYSGGNWVLLNEKTADLDTLIAKLPAGISTDLNDDVEIITQDTDTAQSHYYRRKLGTLWMYIKTKAQDFFAVKDHTHDERYYTESEMDSKLGNKVDNNQAGASSLISKLQSGTAAPTDDDYMITQWANHKNEPGHDNTYVLRPVSSLWSYIKSKADSIYQPKGSYSTTDTKNTAGSTNTTSKLYLIGATSQTANPQTYSNASVYTTGGAIRANGIGNDIFIVYPSNGFASYGGSVTGYCKITLPTLWDSTMMTFTVTIYNYSSNTSVDYRISGYNYAGKPWYNCAAICIGKAGASHSNLAVRFGDNGIKNVITIGEDTTEWSYPRIVIHDVVIGNSDFETYRSGWTVEISKAGATNVSNTITNTHVGYGSVTSWNKISDKPSTYPPEAHNHNASDITSGTLPIARGGTGASDRASALNALSRSDTVLLSGNVDYDTLDSGIYTVVFCDDRDTYHQPPGGSYGYGTLYVTKDDRYGNISQIYIAHSNGQLWFRNRFGSGNVFTDWACTSVWGHNHNDIYYTKDEINNAMTTKSDTGHNHDGRYYTETEVDAKLNSKIGFGTVSAAIVSQPGHNPYIGNVENEDIGIGEGNYYSIINLGSYSGGNFRSQIAMPYQDTISDSNIYVRTAENTNWRPWRKVIHSGNIGAQSVNYASYATYVKDSGDGRNLTLSYSKDGMGYDDFQWLAAWDGNDLRATHKSIFAKANHTHDYLPLSGGTVTGPIAETGAYIQTPMITGETSGGVNATAQTKKAHAIQLGIPGRDYCNFYEYGGVWNFYKSKEAYTQTSGDGNLIAKIDENGIHANLNGTATSLGRNGNANVPMTFNWDGSHGTQPTWLWGGEDGTNMYVYNPSNFNVNYAKSAGAVAWGNVSDKPTTFAPSAHTHPYAGSSSAGGSANSAVKLDTTTAGSATQPVYFKDGKPTACTYTLGKSVPSDAKFTDTNTWRGIQNNLTSTSTTDSLSAAQGKALNDKITNLQNKFTSGTTDLQEGVSALADGVIYMVYE